MAVQVVLSAIFGASKVGGAPAQVAPDEHSARRPVADVAGESHQSVIT